MHGQRAPEVPDIIYIALKGIVAAACIANEQLPRILDAARPVNPVVVVTVWIGGR